MILDLSDFRFERAEPLIFPDTPTFVTHKRCIWHAMLPDHITLEDVMKLVADHAETHAGTHV